MCAFSLSSNWLSAKTEEEGVLEAECCCCRCCCCCCCWYGRMPKQGVGGSALAETRGAVVDAGATRAGAAPNAKEGVAGSAAAAAVGC